MFSSPFILEFDVAAICLLIFLFTSFFIKKINISATNKVFIYLVTSLIITSLFDIISTLDAVSPLMKFILNTFYMLSRHFITLLFVLYFISFNDNRQRYHNIKSVIIVIAPYLVVVSLIIANCFVPIIFTYDELGNYHREILFPLLYLEALVYFVGVWIYIVRYRNSFGKNSIINVGITSAFIILPLIIQYFFGKVLVECFFTSLALLFLSIFIEKSDTYRDYHTGLLNSKAFSEKIYTAVINKNQFSVVLLNLRNMDEIFRVEKYDQAVEELNNFSKELETLIKKHYPYLIDTFYIDRGTFCIIIQSKKSDVPISVSELIDEYVSMYETKVSRMKFIYQVCYLAYPSTINDYDMLINFCRNYSDLELKRDEIVDLASYVHKLSFNYLMDLDEIIDDAIKNERFEMYYQPIYDAKGKCFKTAEALVRLNNEKYGFISPSIFIPHSEKTGKIHDVAHLILRKVFAFVASENYKKLNLDYIEVNLSVVQCLDENLVYEIKNLIHTYKIDPHNINFEITEGIRFSNEEIIRNNICSLCDLGFTFSIDDYGTGYSDIHRFTSLPIRLVKLDKSIVDNFYDEKMNIVIRNSIQMFDQLDIDLVAEGVENQQLANSLIGLGIDYIQGYNYSKPLPESNFVNFVINQNKK